MDQFLLDLVGLETAVGGARDLDVTVEIGAHSEAHEVARIVVRCRPLEDDVDFVARPNPARVEDVLQGVDGGCGVALLDPGGTQHGDQGVAALGPDRTVVARRRCRHGIGRRIGQNHHRRQFRRRMGGQGRGGGGIAQRHGSLRQGRRGVPGGSQVEGLWRLRKKADRNKGAAEKHCCGERSSQEHRGVVPLRIFPLIAARLSGSPSPGSVASKEAQHKMSGTGVAVKLFRRDSVFEINAVALSAGINLPRIP